MEKETFISSSSGPLRHYLGNMRNPAKYQEDCEAMTFCETFRKDVARTEYATHHERLYNACVWLKNDTFCNEFPQNTKDSSGSFPEAVVRRFSLKEVFLRISQNLQEIPRTGVSS